MENYKRFKNTCYSVSDSGNVINDETGLALKPFSAPNGYLQLDLFKDGIKQRIGVHRMVAIAFLDNPEAKEFVNHIDGCKTNNVVENLEWVTPSENSTHAVMSGLSPIGESKTLAKLTEAKVLEIQEAFEAGVKDFVLAERYGVSSGVISAIRLGKIWKHVSGRVFPASGSNPVKKLKATDIPDIRHGFSIGMTDAEIGQMYGVARGTINQIRQGKTWINY